MVSPRPVLGQRLILLVHCFLRLLLLLATFCLMLQADQADKFFQAARKAEKRGEWQQAYVLYMQAAALAPRNAQYWLNGQRIRGRADLQPLFSPLLPGSLSKDLPPKPVGDETQLLGPPIPPVVLRPHQDRETVTITGRGRTLWERVASLYGLRVVFDSDFQEAESARIVLEEANFEIAARTLEAATGTFAVPLGEKVLMVANDTSQKRQELEPAVAVQVSIPTALSAQELQELVQSVRQTVDAKRLYVDSQRGVIVINDAISKVRPAQLLIGQLIAQRGQVGIEVELLQVSNTKFLSYGLSLPTSLSGVYLGTVLGNTPTFPGGFAGFLKFGGGLSIFALGIQNAEAFARMTQGQSQTLIRTNLRSLDAQKAELKIGERYPIATSFFTGIDDSALGTSLVPPSIQYEDLGLVLGVTPHLHGAKEVTLEIEAEFQLLSGLGLNGLPVISNRSFKTTTRIELGETAILSGLLSMQEARSLSGIWGLSQLPVIGPLFRQNTIENSENQVLVLVRPVLIDPPPSSFPQPAFGVGSESRPRVPL